jgi:hypothetical protein
VETIVLDLVPQPFFRKLFSRAEKGLNNKGF